MVCSHVAKPPLNIILLLITMLWHVEMDNSIVIYYFRRESISDELVVMATELCIKP